MAPERESPKAKARAERLINLDYAVANFCHYYPGEFRQGLVGWRYFWMLYAHIPRLNAAQRYNIGEGVYVGNGMINTNEQGRRALQKRQNTEYEYGSDLID